MSEQSELNKAVDEFAEAMKERLESKRKQGWIGWKYPYDIRAESRLLKNAASAVIKRDKKSLIDVANLAMMLWGASK